MSKLAVIGASGMVGETIIKMIEKYNIEYDEIDLYASARSDGKKVTVNGEEITIKELTENAADEKYDYVIMAAGGKLASIYAPLFEAAGSIVVDNSSHFRMQEDIDLIIPEINTPTLNRKIIANPNCSTTQAVVALKPLYDDFGIDRVAYVTYQAVSGSGVAGIDDLKNGEKGLEPTNYPYPIYNNVLPHIDDFLDNGFTKEEQKMVDETKKILNDDEIKVTATCVRVPVENSHSVEMNVTLKNETTVDEIRASLRGHDHIVLMDDVKNLVYPTPLDASGKSEVFVGRIRKDETLVNTFHIWCVSDNLLKGAAQNSVQILKQLQEMNK